MRARVKPRIDLENRTRLETVIPLSVPFIINVDPSDKCNLRCRYCPTADHELMRKTPGRNFGLLDFDLYKKIVKDICQFERPIKVLRLYKDGEPLSHPRFSEMVQYANERGCSERIDTSTNAILLSPQKSMEIINAGLTRIIISVYGMKPEQYLDFAGRRVDFDAIVANVRHFYDNSRGKCEVIVKVIGDVISKEDAVRFYEVFGDIADGLNIDHIMSCWPEFDLESHGVKINPDLGVHGQPLVKIGGEIKEVQVCPYIFYSFSINSDGRASACFLDWERKLIIGDARTQSVKDIWNGIQMLAHQQMMLRGERKRHPVCGNCDQMRRGHPDDIDVYAEELLAKIKKT